MTRILVTGAAGLVGRSLVSKLSAHHVVASDLRRGDLPADVPFEILDVIGADPDRIINAHRPEVIVHLASIVTPPPGMGRDAAFAVDVTGTRNILDAAVKRGVRRIVITSSGAAYGYHADNPVPLRETDACRGNPEFAYADHKRQVEEMLAKFRLEHPQLEQVIFRVGTVLGEGAENQITALFRKRRLLAISGVESPFVFIWTEDLTSALRRAATDGPQGVFNVAGDGVMSVDDIAKTLGKPVVRLPAAALKAALAMARPLGLTRYGPEQVRFLQYRPVLSNDALKDVFGFIPEKTSAEVFDLWRRWANL